MTAVLYHGSKSGSVGPISPSSRSTCDFGRAFYEGYHTLSPDEAIARLKEEAR